MNSIIFLVLECVGGFTIGYKPSGRRA